jgi:hypothetical protein
MSIEAMKQALQALEFAGDLIAPITENCQCKICLAHTALRQAIAEAEKQEPVAFVSKCNDGECLISLINPAAVFYTAPVHASDISQERVDETAKDRHISYVCPNCHWSLNRQEPDTDIYDVWKEKNRG